MLLIGSTVTAERHPKPAGCWTVRNKSTAPAPCEHGLGRCATSSQLGRGLEVGFDERLVPLWALQLKPILRHRLHISGYPS